MKTEIVEGVYLLRGDARTGPHTLDEVRTLLAQGWHNLQTLAWWEGAPAWVPLSQVPGLVLASSPPPPPRRAPVPPRPPSNHPTYTPSESDDLDLSAFWGKVGSAFLIPLIGLVIFGAWLGFPKVGAFFVFLGCYNAYLSIQACEGIFWRKAIAWSAVAASALYVLMTLGMLSAAPSTSEPDPISGQSAPRASGPATLSAWRSYHEALSGMSPNQMNSAQLEQVVVRLSEINTRNVDQDLIAHIEAAGSLLKGACRLVADFESELSTIQSNTQTCGLALGMLFGAIAAESSAGDPYGDAVRAGQAAGELANEAGNLAVYQLQMKYRPQSDALQAKIARFGRDYERLRKQLAGRYGGGF